MEVVMPDEILMPDELPIGGLGAVTNLDSQIVDAQVQTEVAAIHKSKALSVLALGVSGGILGARLAGSKVSGGMLTLAALLGGWGYWSFTSEK